MKEYSTSEIEHIINEYVHKKRDRLILSLRWIDGETYQNIAEHPDVQMSVRGVQYLVERYRKKLLKYFI